MTAIHTCHLRGIAKRRLCKNSFVEGRMHKMLRTPAQVPTLTLDSRHKYTVCRNNPTKPILVWVTTDKWRFGAGSIHETHIVCTKAIASRDAVKV